MRWAVSSEWGFYLADKGKNKVVTVLKNYDVKERGRRKLSGNKNKFSE
jgi:hypothetical protein